MTSTMQPSATRIYPGVNQKVHEYHGEPRYKSMWETLVDLYWTVWKFIKGCIYIFLTWLFLYALYDKCRHLYWWIFDIHYERFCDMCGQWLGV